MFLANNSLIALNINYRPIRSFDNGKTWNKISEEFIDRYKLGFFEKSGVIYGTSTNTIIYSSDYGVTWNSFFDKNVSFTSINIAGSSTSRAFIFNKNTSYNSIIKLKSNTISKLNLPRETPICIETSYRGDDTHFLFYEQDSKTNLYKLAIYTSFDTNYVFQKNYIFENSSSSFINWRLKADFLGNLLLYESEGKKVYISYNKGANWFDISPDNKELINISLLEVSHDNYIYISTLGAGILKYEKQLATPKQLIVNTFNDLNKNCTLDAGEEAISNIKVIVDNNYTAVTDKKEFADYFIQAGNYDVSFEYNPDLYDFCKTSYSVNLGSNSDTLILNVPITSEKVLCRYENWNVQFDSKKMFFKCLCRKYIQ